MVVFVVFHDILKFRVDGEPYSSNPCTILSCPLYHNSRLVVRRLAKCRKECTVIVSRR